ncbi:MAG: PD40 domain-containing protein [Thermoflexales bacterium]|nr:PD40 domain-containing protein [Thermoflexales bacterium]
MDTSSRHYGKVLTVLATLVIVMITWPSSTAHGQGPQPGADMVRFLEQRANEPGRFSQHALAIPSKSIASSPRGLYWQTQVAVRTGDNPIQYYSMALDTSGRPHLSYYVFNYYAAQDDLWYAYWDGAAWQSQLVDGTGNVGDGSSIAIDAASHPHISYCDYTNRALKYAYYDGSNWQIQVVEVNSYGVSPPTSLVLDAEERPHIVYPAGAQTKYAYRDGSTWHIEEIDGRGYAPTANSLALDSKGKPHTSYYYMDNSYRNWARYAYWNGSAWVTQTLGTASDMDGSTALVVDTEDHPHIIYNTTDNTLVHTYYDGVAWRFENTFRVSAGQMPFPLTTDAGSRLHFCYVANEDVWHAYNSDLGWQSQPIDGSNNNGCAIAIGPDGLARVAYTPFSGYGLNYATHLTNAGSWSKLVFASYRDRQAEIYTTDGYGTSPTRLTDHSKSDSTPEFNRDAGQVAFVSNRDGNPEIYKMNADGSGQTRLTATGAGELLPTWSPDSSKIAFYTDRDGDYEIYVMGADGSSQTRLTFDPAWDGHPTWSPDGSQLAFVSKRSGQYELWTMNADGSNQQQLSAGLNYAAYPDWSPDGTQIAFNDDFNADGWYDLAIINTDGTGLRHPLGSSPALYDDLAPSWAPDGTSVAFARVQWINYQGDWYWVDAYVHAMNVNKGISYVLGDADTDWWPDWQSTDTAAPASWVGSIPTWSGTAFSVRWSGNDSGGSHLHAYDVQYRDGITGVWTDWLLGTTKTSAVFSGQEGHTYFFRSRARDFAFNVGSYPAGNGDAFTTVDTVPPTSAASSPPTASTLRFQVIWSGHDSVSGIMSYDVQVRDGVLGVWSDWLSATTANSAFFNGELGHSYYFRSRARDRAGNVETFPGGDGDSFTKTPDYQASGQVTNNRHQAIFNATVGTQPPALNVARTDGQGNYTLYFSSTGTYTLTVNHVDFGTLPPRYGIVVSGSVAGPDFVMPPANDVLVNGGWESGDLTGWHIGAGVTPTIDTAAAHTGHYGIRLDASGGTLGFWSYVTQSVSIPITWSQPTLSWLYRVTRESGDNEFLVVISGDSTVLTQSVAMQATSDWAHAWYDLSAFIGQTVTMQFGFQTQTGTQQIYLDEISLGEYKVGVLSTYLPLITRNHP